MSVRGNNWLLSGLVTRSSEPGKYLGILVTERDTGPSTLCLPKQGQLLGDWVSSFTGLVKLVRITLIIPVARRDRFAGCP